jgi:hypothetical protein
MARRHYGIVFDQQSTAEDDKSGTTTIELPDAGFCQMADEHTFMWFVVTELTQRFEDESRWEGRSL